MLKSYNDSNYYYTDLDIPPWASEQEIKTALRKAYRRHHPDGTDPDSEKFMRFKEIEEVLLNPTNRERYDATKKGEVFIDSQVRSFLVGHGIAIESVAVPFEDSIEEPHPEDREIFWDYFSFDHDPWDMLKAQEWYEALVSVAPLFRYTSSIRVLLHDEEPNWLSRSRMVMIPRSWKPNSANAFALFSVVMGVA